MREEWIYLLRRNGRLFKAVGRRLPKLHCLNQFNRKLKSKLLHFFNFLAFCSQKLVNQQQKFQDLRKAYQKDIVSFSHSRFLLFISCVFFLKKWKHYIKDEVKIFNNFIIFKIHRASFLLAFDHLVASR